MIIRTYKILFILFLIPIILLLRATTLVDEKSLRRMIEDKTITEFWKVYVPDTIYAKYNVLQNLEPIKLEDSEIQKANEIGKKNKISYDLASLIIFANKKLIPRIFTMEEITPETRHSYPRLWFTSPIRNYKEDQLQRYIESQQAKGFTNNEIRETLLGTGWKKDIVNKYLNPEKDIADYVKQQRLQGKTLNKIRKQLLESKWNKSIVDKYIPQNAVLREFIQQQHQGGKRNEFIRKLLLQVGWKPTFVNKFLNPEKDLKAYIVAQQQKGIADEKIKKQLLAVGWKKEIVERYLKK